MAGFNRVILLGNLTRNPELRQTQNGVLAGRLVVAVNRLSVLPDGNTREEVVFVDVDVFGKIAEIIGKHFFKGSPILVEGRLKQENWTDKQTGQSRSKLVVVLERFEFVGGKSQNNYQSGGAAKEWRPSDGAKSAPAKDLEDEDVPF